MLNKKSLFIILSLPLVYIMYSFLSGDVVDITDFLYEVTGSTAIFMLFATTFASVIKKVKFRKMLGLFTFFYAFVHFLVFAFLDFQFDIEEIIKETTDKPFIYLGSISFIILTILAITSFKSLFKRFMKIQEHCWNQWMSIFYKILVLMFNLFFFLLRDKPLLVYKLDQNINTLKLVKNKMTYKLDSRELNNVFTSGGDLF